MGQAEFEEHVGRDNICPNIAAALERAAQSFAQRPAPQALAR
jgi:hypothetical protein